MVSCRFFQIRLDMDDPHWQMIQDVIRVTCKCFVGREVHVLAYLNLTKVLEGFVPELYALLLLGLCFCHLIFKLVVSISLRALPLTSQACRAEKKESNTTLPHPLRSVQWIDI